MNRAADIRSREAKALEAFRRKDFVSAIRLAEELAESGSNYGRILFARLLTDARTTPQELARAEQMLDQAEALGSAEASYQKAAIFALRNDAPRYFEAVRKAAQGGVLPAKCALGRCYIWGNGVDQDVARGEAILVEAAALGSISARHALAFYRAQHSRSLGELIAEFGRALFYGWYARFIRWVNPTSDRLG